MDVVGRRHGHQTLDPREGHGAALSRADQTAADAVLAVVLRRRSEDAVGAEALHGHGHAVCKQKVKQNNNEWSLLFSLKHRPPVRIWILCLKAEPE